MIAVLKKKNGRLYKVLLGLENYSVEAHFDNLEDAIDCMIAAEYKYWDIACVHTMTKKVLFSSRYIYDYAAIMGMHKPTPVDKLGDEELRLYNEVTKGRINDVG